MKSVILVLVTAWLCQGAPFVCSYGPHHGLDRGGGIRVLHDTRAGSRLPDDLRAKLSLAPRSDKVDIAVDPREDATDPRGNFGATTLTPTQIDQLPDDVDELERILQEMAGPGAVVRVNRL